MKSLTEHLWFNVPNRRGYINITEQVEELARQKRRPGGALPGQRYAYHRVGLHQ